MPQELFNGKIKSSSEKVEKYCFTATDSFTKSSEFIKQVTVVLSQKPYLSLIARKNISISKIYAYEHSP